MMTFAWCKRGTTHVVFLSFLVSYQTRKIIWLLMVWGDSYENLIIASFWFAQRMILGWLESQFHSCARASNLSSVGSPNSTTHKDLTSGVVRIHVWCFTVTEAIRRANRSSPLFQGAKFVCTLVVLIIILFVRIWKSTMRITKLENSENKVIMVGAYMKIYFLLKVKAGLLSGEVVKSWNFRCYGIWYHWKLLWNEWFDL